jgi:2-octaprenyl-6-methoxyphenol hydroxylase
MNICIIGDNLTALSLAKNLINKKLNVHVFYKKKEVKNQSTRTIGISRDNIDFFNKKIIKINSKLLWNINKIEIFTQKKEKQKILDFQNRDKKLFSIIKSDDLYKLLNSNLLKSKYFHKKKIIDNNLNEKFLKKYDLIINCDPKNRFTKKFFSKNLNKNYNVNAYTTIIKHKILNNNSAVQIFTKNGPIAFLPISKSQTSVVFSMNILKNKIDNKKVVELIKKNNSKYFITNFEEPNKAKLNFINLRNYYYKNILAFGDLLHKIHPLAGQGFNMTIRDIKILSKIIDDKISIGLLIDTSVASEFENKVKHKNFIFSNGIDFIHEFFNLDAKLRINKTSKLMNFFGKNEFIKNNLIKYADKGF